jgi:hypothetical protein
MENLGGGSPGFGKNTGWYSRGYRLVFKRVPAGIQEDTGWYTRGYRLVFKRVPAGIREGN